VDVVRAAVALLAALVAAFVVSGAWRVPGAGATERRPLGRVAAWAASVAAVDEALAQRDVAVAARRAEEAYRAALASRSWEAMAAVGDAYVELADLSGVLDPWVPRARAAYLAALVRASAAGSAAGSLRAAEAFAGLGDTDAAGGALRIADRLAERAGDQQVRQRVAGLAERLSVNLRPGLLAMLFGRWR
jgi:hypothetical protein